MSLSLRRAIVLCVLTSACSGSGGTVTSGSFTTDIGVGPGYGGGGGFVADVTVAPDAPVEPDVGAPDVTPDVEPDVPTEPDVAPGCVSGTPCNDGDLCTVNDQCTQTGECAGTPISCDDGAPCTLDSCTGGVCSSVVAPGYCYIEETCWNEAQPHPTDACKRCVPNQSASTWSVLLGAACDDGDPCTEEDACSASGCAGEVSLCDDENPCTTDSCGAAGCVYTPNQSPCGPGDGNPCSTGQCDKGACVTVPKTGPCTDGEPCTIGDSCQGGQCVPGPLKDKDQDGHADLLCGGDDCDDADKTVYPGLSEVCGDGVDNDCNGLTDADEEACANCAYHTDCYPERLCGYWPSVGELRCSVPCGSPADCDAGEICAHLPGSANLGYCRPSAFPGAGASGAACNDGPECGSEVCADLYCVDTCANQVACTKPAHICHPAGDLVLGFQGVCSPTAAFPQGYPNGAKCYGNAGNCQSGHCDLWGDDTCRPMCVTDDECTFAQQCNVVLRSSGPIADSVPFDPQFTVKTYDAALGCFNRTASGNQKVGTVCTANGQCRSGKCLALVPGNSTMYCTGYCRTDADCPATMRCKQEGITLASGFLQAAGQALPGAHTFVRICKLK